MIARSPAITWLTSKILNRAGTFFYESHKNYKRSIHEHDLPKTRRQAAPSANCEGRVPGHQRDRRAEAHGDLLGLHEDGIDEDSGRENQLGPDPGAIYVLRAALEPQEQEIAKSG